MIIGENQNWFVNLAVPLSDWNDTISCCQDVIIALRTVESLNIILTTVLGATMVRLLRTSNVLHINFRVLLIASVINDIFLLNLRIFEIINVSGLLTEHSDLQFLRYTSIIFGVTLPLTIVIERIYALRNYRTYENALVYYVVYTRTHARSIMEIRYRRMSNNLTSRYQILEAERSSHMLTWYIPFQACSTIFTITIAIVIRAIVFTRTPRYFLLALQILYTFVGLKAIISMTIVMQRHPILRQELRKSMQKYSRKRIQRAVTRSSVSTTNRIAVLSSHGEPLNFTSEQERNIYFQ
ncbi:hypothetical protein PRIPAC_77602, partial [Pristionchus pacificus]|uniref:Uncharacterized protein n=1 Tax=Pristionchus pacificus TaxID=54126 RepID=A0A2A6CQF7_PRIPA